MTRWYEEEEANNWLLNSLTAQSYVEIHRILQDECLLEEAVCCMALAEQRLSAIAFSQKVDEILKSADQRLDAAVFLLYKDALTLVEAQKLSAELKSQQGFNHNFPKPKRSFFTLANSPSPAADDKQKIKI